jgi:hypothetical protein
VDVAFLLHGLTRISFNLPRLEVSWIHLLVGAWGVGIAVIHIGVSKTATTTLQQNVFERLDGVSFLGKPGPHDTNRTVDGFSKGHSVLLERAIETMVAGRSCPSEDIETLRAAIEKLKARDAPVVYSNEILTENKFLSFAEIAAGLNDIFGPSELLVTVRDPQTALPSAYMHEILRFPRSYLCFSKWLDDAIANPRRINHPAESLEQYRYALMLKQFHAVFEKVTILGYEDLVATPSAFSASLARLLGADPKRIEGLLALPPKNPTRSELFYRYRRLANKFRSLVPLLDLSSFSVARKLSTAIEVFTQKLPKKSVALSERDRARIAQFFPYPVDEKDWRLGTSEETRCDENAKKTCGPLFILTNLVIESSIAATLLASTGL